MFERNRADTQEPVSVAVKVVFDDGNEMAGKLLIPASRSVFDVLQGPSLFLEFEPFEGERRYVAKSSMKTVTLLAGTRPKNLAQKARDMDGFDPHALLGVKPDAAWDDVRTAYLGLAKTYHPDRFASAELPTEVAGYMSAMSRRVNAAYAALELARQVQRAPAARMQDAVYVSGARG